DTSPTLTGALKGAELKWVVARHEHGVDPQRQQDERDDRDSPHPGAFGSGHRPQRVERWRVPDLEAARFHGVRHPAGPTELEHQNGDQDIRPAREVDDRVARVEVDENAPLAASGPAAHGAATADARSACGTAR